MGYVRRTQWGYLINILLISAHTMHLNLACSNFSSLKLGWKPVKLQVQKCTFSKLSHKQSKESMMECLTALKSHKRLLFRGSLIAVHNIHLRKEGNTSLSSGCQPQGWWWGTVEFPGAPHTGYFVNINMGRRLLGRPGVPLLFAPHVIAASF